MYEYLLLVYAPGEKKEKNGMQHGKDPIPEILEAYGCFYVNFFFINLGV